MSESSFDLAHFQALFSEKEKCKKDSNPVVFGFDYSIHDIESNDGKIIVKRGDLIVELHLNSPTKINALGLRSKANEAFLKIIKEAEKKHKVPKIIIAQTYPALANLLLKNGFAIAKRRSGLILKKLIYSQYRKTDKFKKGVPMGDPITVFMEFDKFKEKYGNYPTKNITV